MSELTDIRKRLAIVSKIRAVAEKNERSCGVLVKQLRLRKKLSLRAMAKELGISAPYLSDIEWGRRKVSARVLDEISKI